LYYYFVYISNEIERVIVNWKYGSYEGRNESTVTRRECPRGNCPYGSHRSVWNELRMASNSVLQCSLCTISAVVIEELHSLAPVADRGGRAV
jgi:hypothetical protein